MALLASIHVNPGWALPDMDLQTPAGEILRLHDTPGENGLFVAFTCNHCPYALAVWPRLIRLAAKLRGMGVNTIAVNPNIHPDYPEDSMPVMLEKIAEWGIDFPYLADVSQHVARRFNAQCTPDLFLFDKAGRLYYHGRIDDDWKDERKVTQLELLPAAVAMVAGKAAPQPQHPTIGCSIKWKE